MYGLLDSKKKGRKGRSEKKWGREGSKEEREGRKKRKKYERRKVSKDIEISSLKNKSKNNSSVLDVSL